MFLVGRTKEMINRGGEKISPREVDEVLAQHPAVLQVITFAAPHATLGEEAAAAIVLRPGASATVREIQNFAVANLADFKVPRRIVFLDKISLGPTGKPQRIGLAAKLGIEAERTEYLAPRTPTKLNACRLSYGTSFFGSEGRDQRGQLLRIGRPFSDRFTSYLMRRTSGSSESESDARRRFSITPTIGRNWRRI